MSKPMTGYYSVVQYMPNRSRAEGFNIGVLLLVPGAGFLRAKMGYHLHHLLQFLDRMKLPITEREPDVIRLTLDVPDRLTTLEAVLDAVNGFINTRANDLYLTPLRPLTTDDPAAELGRLFKELVL